MFLRIPSRAAIAAAATTLLAVALTGVVHDRPAIAVAGLANGEYDCGGSYPFRAMGKVDIQNGRFRYRPFGKVVNSFAPYSVGGDDLIAWGGPFGGLDDAPAQIVKSKREKWGFNVDYRSNPNGMVHTMSCSLPKT